MQERLAALERISGSKRAPRLVIVRQNPDGTGYTVQEHRYQVGRRTPIVKRFSVADPRDYKPPEGLRGPVLHLYRGGKPQE